MIAKAAHAQDPLRNLEKSEIRCASSHSGFLRSIFTYYRQAVVLVIITKEPFFCKKRRGRSHAVPYIPEKDD